MKNPNGFVVDILDALNEDDNVECTQSQLTNYFAKRIADGLDGSVEPVSVRWMLGYGVAPLLYELWELRNAKETQQLSTADKAE